MQRSSGYEDCGLPASSVLSSVGSSVPVVLASTHQHLGIAFWEEIEHSWYACHLVIHFQYHNSSLSNCDRTIPSNCNQHSCDALSCSILRFFLGCSGGDPCWGTLSLIHGTSRPELGAFSKSFCNFVINLAAPQQIYLHVISRPPWGRSEEKHLWSVTSHTSELFLLRKK